MRLIGRYQALFGPGNTQQSMAPSASVKPRTRSENRTREQLLEEENTRMRRAIEVLLAPVPRLETVPLDALGLRLSEIWYSRTHLAENILQLTDTARPGRF
jgi:lambda repressor-like predicted transcriptional regulator